MVKAEIKNKTSFSFYEKVRKKCDETISKAVEYFFSRENETNTALRMNGEVFIETPFFVMIIKYFGNQSINEPNKNNNH